MARLIINSTTSFNIGKKSDIKKVKEYIKPGDIVSYHRIEQQHKIIVGYIFKAGKISTKTQQILADTSLIISSSKHRNPHTGNMSLVLKEQVFRDTNHPSFNLTDKGMILRKVNLVEAIYCNRFLLNKN